MVPGPTTPSLPGHTLPHSTELAWLQSLHHFCTSAPPSTPRLGPRASFFVDPNLPLASRLDPSRLYPIFPPPSDDISSLFSIVSGFTPATPPLLLLPGPIGIHSFIRFFRRSFCWPACSQLLRTSAFPSVCSVRLIYFRPPEPWVDKGVVLSLVLLAPTSETPSFGSLPFRPSSPPLPPVPPPPLHTSTVPSGFLHPKKGTVRLDQVPRVHRLPSSTQRCDDRSARCRLRSIHPSRRYRHRSARPDRLGACDHRCSPVDARDRFPSSCPRRYV